MLPCLSTFGNSLHYKHRAFVTYLVPHTLGLKLATSPLATSSGVCSSGWTVCYSGDKSRDSGMAIS